MKEDFVSWLENQLKNRGMRPADLVKCSGGEISSGHLSKILNRERPPGISACRGIARALGLSDVEVIRVAGLADPEPPRDSPTITELLREFSQLSADDQEAVLKQARALNALARSTRVPKTRGAGA